MYNDQDEIEQKWSSREEKQKRSINYRQKVVLVMNCSQMVTDVDAGEDMQDKWLADVYGPYVGSWYKSIADVTASICSSFTN